MSRRQRGRTREPSPDASTAGWNCGLSLFLDHDQGEILFRAGADSVRIGQKGLIFHGEVFTIEDLYLLLADQPVEKGTATTVAFEEDSRRTLGKIKCFSHFCAERRNNPELFAVLDEHGSRLGGERGE